MSTITIFASSWRGRLAAWAILLAVSACGGGGSDGGGGGSSPPPPVTASIGAAGGTVNGPFGAQVAIPASALATSTSIGIEQSSVGAPALPAGVTAFGPIFAFTPHGTSFAVPVTITVPFDPALVPPGTTPALYKTNAAMTGWAEVAGATVNGSSMSGAVTGFSFSFIGPKLTPFVPQWVWTFAAFPGNGGSPVPLPKPDGQGTQDGGLLEKVVDFGKAFFDRPILTITPDLRRLEDGEANGLVAASEDGRQFGAFTEAPNGRLTSPNDIGSSAKLVQRQSFRKKAEDASLTLTLTNAEIETTDFHGTADSDGNLPEALRPHFLISGLLHYTVKVYQGSRTFFDLEAVAHMSGNGSIWTPDASSVGSTRKPFWSKESFDFSTTPIIHSLGNDACRGTGASLKLKAPLPITIDLSSVGIKGESSEFSVEVTTEVQALNRRGGGDRLDCAIASASAFLRDPQQTSGTTMTFAGLEPTNQPLPPPPEQPLVAPARCSTPNPAAGILQFEAPSFAIREFAGAPPVVKVTRTGGSSGEVSATFTTSDGTAIGGTDYSPVNATVFFADGDASPRLVIVPTIQNQIVQPDKTVQLTLSDPGGCARLGAQSTALLTITDDNDAPAPPPAPSTQLDSTFGSAGTVTTPFGGKNTAMALQPDGKIVMAGGSISDFQLARYNADGSLDAGFGTGGLVTTDIGGFTQEEARAVAVQPDGKIVVAGNVRVSEVRGGTLFDEFNFTLVRYNADGSLDSRFGAAGKVKSSVLGRAFALAMQSGGQIVVAGDDTLAAAVSNVKLARFNADGSLDTSFGSLGSVTTDVTAGVDGANNLVLQPDGKIVVSGSFSKSSATGVARYLSNGSPDGSFGAFGSVALDGAFVGEGLALQSDGKLVLVGSKQVGVGTANVTQFEVRRLNANGGVDVTFGNAGTVNTAFGTGQDSAAAVALQRDGKILVSGQSDAFKFALARYAADGTLDASFGTAGKLEVVFFGSRASAENIAIQPDGKVVLGGFADSGRPGYALARLQP
jgi:uncharacterized delta-60 repeat protein